MDQALVKSLFSYNPETGDFLRLSNGRKAGSLFKNSAGNLYWRVTAMVDGKKRYFFAHRLAWLYMTGSWPEEYIDHINHNGLDNHWLNLRQATNEINQKNARIPKDNKTGIAGVCLVTRSQRWHAWISRNKIQAHLGVFSDFFEACCARKSAELQHDYHPNYGLA